MPTKGINFWEREKDLERQRERERERETKREDKRQRKRDEKLLKDSKIKHKERKKTN